jgi:hypothetical protein
VSCNHRLGIIDQASERRVKLEEKKQKEVKLEIHLDEDLAQGAYANLAVVNHNESEFVVDFIFVQPQAPRAKVRSRVILSPQHAKRFVAVLNENIGRYEKNFGKIALKQLSEDDANRHYH